MEPLPDPKNDRQIKDVEPPPSKVKLYQYIFYTHCT